jgi:NAD(P)-dependent dehydrogenase (short-subunit alcohol dehydrogenase family)
MKVIADVSSKRIPELFSLEGRNAVVTGGGRGLGKAIAVRLAEAGANVLIADIETQLALDAASEIQERFKNGSSGIFVGKNIAKQG